MNKKLIAILTLVMFAMTLLPMGAFAASKNSIVGHVPTVTTTDTTGTKYVFPEIEIDEDKAGNMKSGNVLLFTLPSGLEFKDITTFEINGVGDGVIGTTGRYRGFDIVLGADGDQSVAVKLHADDADSTPAILNIALGQVAVKTKGSGDIVLNIDAEGTGLTGGDFVIGTFGSGSASASVVSKKTASEGPQTLGTIRITENTAGAVDGKITLVLPNDVEWGYSVGDTFPSTQNLVLRVDKVDGKKMEVSPLGGTVSTSAAIIDIPASVVIDSAAKLGDIEVEISGKATGTVVVGTYADYSVEIKADEPKELKAGKAGQKMAKLVIKDVIDGSLLNGRTVRIELPEGVRFATGLTLPTVTIANGSHTGAKLSDEGRVLTFTLNTTTGKTEIELKDVKLDVAPRFVGEVNVEIKGTAGATGEAVVANVESAVKVETEATTLKIGVQSQELNDIFITESKKEIFKQNEIVTLKLDNGLVFAATPKVEVLEGNLDIELPTRKDGEVSFKVKSESTKPATIKISGIKVTADRTIPEGEIKATISGKALVDDMFEAVAGTQEEWNISVKSAAAFKVATVVTPAGENVVQPVTMTVGSTVYTIDGVEVEMDVAPYIKNDRTFFPVRFVANALGINDENVVWDPAQRTVTIFRANRIVQVAIGSTTMLVNGVPVTMDVAPEITAERTMLPIRFVAQGLGVNVIWDAATQTVTLN